MQIHWLKELVSKPAFDRYGKQIPFEVFGGDYGGIVVDDELNPELAEDLAKLAGTQGILRSSAADFQKKNSTPKHTGHRDPRGEIRPFNPPKPIPQPPGAAAAVNQSLSPLAPMPSGDVAQPGPTAADANVPVVGTDPMNRPASFKPRTGRPKKAA